MVLSLRTDKPRHVSRLTDCSAEFFDKKTADGGAKRRGYGVSDLFGNCGFRADPQSVVRESLQLGRFQVGYGSMLRRVEVTGFVGLKNSVRTVT